MLNTVRIASFNIKWAALSSLSRVADTLRALDAHVIALQEVDHGTRRTGRVDQSEALGKLLGYDARFAPARRHGSGRFGNAILTRLAVTDVRRVSLRHRFSFESRVALDVRIQHGNRAFRVVSTHFDILPWSARSNARALADHLSGHEGGVVVAGDLNAAPGHDIVRTFTDRGFVDAHEAHARHHTFPSHRPLRRLDYVLVDPRLRASVRHAHVDLHARTSDHLPIVATLAFE